MRLLLATRNRGLVGGMETYVQSAIAAFTAAGVEVALLTETGTAPRCESIDVDLWQAWCVADLGFARAMQAAGAWRPDLVYVHGLEDAALESALIDIAPAIYFAHGYHGACISGEKMFKNPAAEPCDRRFGWECLLQYYPRRCGGLSPLTMWRDFQREVSLRDRFIRFAAIVVTSEHSRREYSRVARPEHVFKVPMLVNSPVVERSQAIDAYISRDARRIVCAGRMTALKGGSVLLDALPEVAEALEVPIELTMAGDGPSRAAWEEQAGRITSRYPGVSIKFPGWLTKADLGRLIARSNLHVMPSLWPEPFGLIGAEAACAAVPSAAFDVGGISEWLIDGVGGFLAAANPPSAAGLARAMIKCLRDEQTRARLSRGAFETSRRFRPEVHVAAMLDVFRRLLPQAEAGRARIA
jgi:glycosyltransferase involved in cell wall biosynthesis